MTHLIKSTMDYNKFRKLNGNRPVRPNHVKRIVESMQKQMLPTFIEVNEHYEIIDGQHRIEALKKLELPVNYIVNVGAGLQEAQRHNEIKQKWSYLDILESHCAAENENYIFIRYLMNQYHLALLNVLCACEKGNHGQHKQYMFQEGTLEITNKKEVEELVRKALKINAVTSIMRKTMWTACLKCLQNADFDVNVFIQKLAYLKDQFTPQVTVKQQIAQIEEIYNYRNRNKVNLRITK